jgi:ribosomal protein S25
MTEEQKAVANRIVTHLKEVNGVKTHVDTIRQRFENTPSIKSDVSYVLNILEEKNTIKCSDGWNRQMFYLMPNRWHYTSFDELIHKEKASKEKKDRKDEIDLRNAERVYKTYSTTRFITWVTFAIAVILALLKLAEALKLWPYNTL